MIDIPFTLTEQKFPLTGLEGCKGKLHCNVTNQEPSHDLKPDLHDAPYRALISNELAYAKCFLIAANNHMQALLR